MADRVLLTGPNGYVGGRVAQALAADGRFALRLAGRREPSYLPSLAGVEFAQWPDLASMQVDEAPLAKSLEGLSHVVHLAAPHEIDSAKDPERATLVTTIGTQRLLRLAEKAGVKRFVYFSTAHVYGAPLAGTLTEQSLPRPMHPYAITHKAAEDFVLATNVRPAMRGVVVRLSNSVGAPASPEVDRWTLLANDLCRQAVTTGKMVLKSSGLQWRDFIPMQDVCRAVAHLLTVDREALADGLFNLGAGSARVIDIVEMIQRIAGEELGHKPEIVRPAPSPGEAHAELNFRTDKLRSTGFRPQGRLEQELRETLQLCSTAFRSDFRTAL
jgi:UDP-glucose 4-epimerase